MTDKTITSIYLVQDIATKIKGQDYVYAILEKQLQGIEAELDSENNVHHLAFYTQKKGEAITDLVVIVNADYYQSAQKPLYALEKVESVVSERLEEYQQNKKVNIENVNRTISNDHKLDDYSLMKMCGLLPKD